MNINPAMALGKAVITMGFTFETHGSVTYLVYRIECGETTDAASLGMLINNTITGLAPLYYTQSDSEVFLRYAVTSKISVKDFFAGEVTRRMLTGVFSGIAASAAAAEEYLLDVSTLVLDPEYIFVDVTTLRTSLVCLPVAGRVTGSPELRGFFKELIINARYDARENREYVAGVINYLNGTAPFTPGGLSDTVRQFERYDAGDRPGDGREPAAAQFVAPRPAEISGEAPGKGRERPAELSLSGDERGGAQSAEIAAGKDCEAAPISLPYLLMHYSRGNRLLYNSGRRRAGKRSAASAAAALGEREGFAIPGEAPPPIGGGDGAGAAARVEKPAIRREKRRGGRRGEYSDAQEQGNAPAPRPPPSTARRGFGDTVVLGAGAVGETTVLYDPGSAAGGTNGAATPGSGENAPYLIRAKSDERIELDKPVFRIGKEPSYADYCIADNSAVSRGHAYIATRGGQCTLADTNSANHTYLGGEMLTCGREYALTHGARFRLANEEFEFRLH
ncbi:MAG: FHA domain-containing protein [Oscillospiraceae bacterium]|jgi:hypothetical protein|nr:FHA domain-containing protein [Oscillospiraceae bacterium]